MAACHVCSLASISVLMTRIVEHVLVYLVFMVSIMFLVLRRAAPEMVMGPADPPLPPPAPALAEATTPGLIGKVRMRLKVSVHPDRIVVGQPLYGRRTIMADQLTGLANEFDGSLRIDHVAGTLRATPIRLPLPAGAPLRQTIEWFAANRPALSAPTPAPGKWTFIRVWVPVAGATSVGFGIYEVTRGNPMGVQIIIGSLLGAVVVWLLGTGRFPIPTLRR
ncbi:hypothetical protein [Actinophytocola algeriensis]|uniref:Uncharacterized protein n=1 Tax=Actinophytocola algeriensis TaxID=1768010 RepID=A0A7W7Q750_9PSEU|nr:hypothetical protein [Actinophytocola algeriensis]MBB4908152.1 hypothetical protein [Actinophytocola algeriensis]MBE1480182.1 hypothetical protein [Actinophytocola algeriensis]